MAVFAAFLYLFIALQVVIHIRQDVGSEEISPYVMHSFINIRYFNQWLSWLLPLLPAALYLSVPRCRPVLWRGAVLLLMALLWAALWHTEGRGTLYAFIGCAVLLPLLFGRLAMRWLGWQAVSALAGLVLSLIWLGADWPFWGEQARNVWSATDAGRLPLWRMSWHLFAEHPFLGVGPMHFAALHFNGPGHPHSAVMQILAEWGGLAFSLLMAALVWVAVRWLRELGRWKPAVKVSTSERMLVVSITASILTAGAHSLVSSVLVTPVSLLMLVVVFSLAASWYHHRQVVTGSVPLSSGQPSRWQRMLAKLPVLVACFYLGVVGLKESLNHSYIWEIGFQSDLGPYSPRFWHQGSLLYRLDEPWLSFSHSGEPREHPAKHASPPPD